MHVWIRLKTVKQANPVEERNANSIGGTFQCANLIL